VDRAEIHALLTRVASGATSAESALQCLVSGPLRHGLGYADVGFARVDTHRGLRTGDPEVVYAAGKTPEETVAILRTLRETSSGRPALASRVSRQTADAIEAAFTDALIDRPASCAAVGPLPQSRGTVCVVTAGTSDSAVSAEAAFMTRAFGANVEQIRDIGVAGLHRLLAVREQLDVADCVIVVAGMDGALPSVVGGLIQAPVIAVPTSVGYGTSLGGLAPLLSMLNSCAPGVVVCGIDNGFGAGIFAARVARRISDGATQ
jgi:pyridinium-3,5-biscarboxylic acid mononucleotide synthase